MAVPPNHQTPIWWVLDGKLAGMPMPWLHPMRRESGGAALNAYDDEMQSLWDAGIRSVACLLNIPGDKRVYEAAGLNFFCLPLPDGGAPTDGTAIHQLHEFYLTSPSALAVHCEAGIGRTGTIIALLLIAEGANFAEAISQVRSAQPGAVETSAQVRFLSECSSYFGGLAC